MIVGWQHIGLPITWPGTNESSSAEVSVTIMATAHPNMTNTAIREDCRYVVADWASQGDPRQADV